MHKLTATSTILESELSELRLLVERQTGVVLDCSNSAFAAHVADYIEAIRAWVRPRLFSNVFAPATRSLRACTPCSRA